MTENSVYMSLKYCVKSPKIGVYSRELNKLHLFLENLEYLMPNVI